jgi:hypothetical protein
VAAADGIFNPWNWLESSSKGRIWAVCGPNRQIGLAAMIVAFACCNIGPHLA